MNSLSRRTFLAGSAAAVAGSLATKLIAAEAPKFQLGMISYNVAKDWDLPTILKVCKDVGIAAIEARTTHKHGIELARTPAERADIKKQFADSGVVFWGCGSACEFHSADPAVVKKNIEETKQFIQLAKDLGGRGVKVRPNGVPKGGDEARTFDQIGKALRECGKAAADAGVEIWMEVHGAITSVPKNSRTILDACGHPAVGACWNSNVAEVENGSIEANFNLLKDFIKHVHINDLTNDAAGKYPYRDLFKRLKAIGYDRYTMCEYGKAFDPSAGAEFMRGYKKMWSELANG